MGLTEKLPSPQETLILGNYAKISYIDTTPVLSLLQVTTQNIRRQNNTLEN